MEKTKVIGIDPDIDRSGVCYLYVPTRQVEVSAMAFPELLEYLSTYESDCNVVVVVEASWKTAHNWHGRWGDNNKVSSSKGYDIGRNHEVGKKIVEMLNHWNIPVVEKTPLKKIWKGRDGKITHEELSAFVSGLPSKTNQENRDACLLAWDYAGFPIRITPVSKRLITDNGEMTPAELIKKMTKKNKNYTI